MNNMSLWVIQAGTKVSAKTAKEEIRFLGIWIQEKKGHNHTTKRLTNTISHFNTQINNKKITTSIYVYLVNHVLIPKPEYLHQISIVNDNELANLDKPLSKKCKHITNL